MSHLSERDEKNCLNCNARVYGRYCHICGQQNLEPNESLWHLITHFFNDITHFDGKFFSTLKLLITKPGFLSGEYQRGRRASYLNPVRMYIFTSFTFFLIFFSVFNLETLNQGFTDDTVQTDSTLLANSMMDSGVLSDKKMQEKDSSNKISFTGKNYRDAKEYDSLKAAGVVKENWVMDHINYQTIKIKEKYGNDNKKIMIATVNIFVHNFPQILFVSLPLVAFFLWLIYIRKKDFYFVAHGIYSVHLYIFYFITFLVIMGFSWLGDKFRLDWMDYILYFLLLALFFYEYKAMRHFYQQRRAKTIFKFFLVLTWRLVIFLILFVSFFIFSFLKI